MRVFTRSMCHSRLMFGMSGQQRIFYEFCLDTYYYDYTYHNFGLKHKLTYPAAFLNWPWIFYYG